MSAPRYTPGPWSTKKPQFHGMSVIGPQEVTVAWCGANATFCSDGSYRITDYEAAANARLIAAAPAMFTTLCKARAILSRFRYADGCTRDDVDSICDAIDEALQQATEPTR